MPMLIYAHRNPSPCIYIHYILIDIIHCYIDFQPHACALLHLNIYT